MACNDGPDLPWRTIRSSCFDCEGAISGPGTRCAPDEPLFVVARPGKPDFQAGLSPGVRCERPREGARCRLARGVELLGDSGA